MTRSQKALERAIDSAGGQDALAKKLGVTQSLVSYWLRGAKKGVPAEKVADIERITLVPRHELRPDLYPSPLAGEMRGGAKRAAQADRDGGHFSRFKSLRRGRYKSAEEIEGYIRALREEWSRR